MDIERERNYQRRKAQASRVRTIARLIPVIKSIKPVAYHLLSSWEKQIRKNAEIDIAKGHEPPGAIRDRMEIGVAVLRTIGRAIIEDRISSATIEKLLNILVGEAIIKQGDKAAKEEFRARFGSAPPAFVLISPTKKCNLLCTGCYADSDRTEIKLSWPVLDQIVSEARELWGCRFFVLSGGEPLLYRDEGHTIMDLVEKHSDCFFLMYTNGTLIDEKMAKRMSLAGNIMPAISVEGLKERTEARRGRGIFDRILKAFDNLRQEKVFFGISVTITRENAYEVFSDETIDFYFNQQKVNFAWAFQYMPIGRAYTLDLLPTPEQRRWMFQRTWELVYDRHHFLIDFWNSGTATKGCIAAGRSGGYLVVNWDGSITPCAFIPYSPININDIYNQGQNLNQIWEHPFLADLRKWQKEYGYSKNHSKEGPVKNWIMPCPMRDHFRDMYELLQKHHPKPLDQNAAEALSDPDYYKGLVEYNQRVADLMDPIWEEKYIR
ncbi:MAG: radical SAM protein [Acidobacteriota bacterium]|nr:radical SAM protein [Acidobacteriota bacterium]MDW3228449.1 radical SAM protein [Acidobacteriota bacterium]MDY0231330.1 radical SAM protein [Candidatus Saccharicenans sp.]